jgi:hypothetical protein
MTREEIEQHNKLYPDESMACYLTTAATIA